MTERPILFSAPMVRAILEGRKTQTRRILNPQPPGDQHRSLRDVVWGDDAQKLAARSDRSQHAWAGFDDDRTNPAIAAYYHCPYGQPGDRLYVRESFSGPHEWQTIPPAGWGWDTGTRPPIWYWADGNPEHGDWTRPKPSIHMPRWASRILLEITDVRVQRVQDISEEDARAEGVLWVPGHGEITPADLHEGYSNYLDCRQGFWALWDSINAKRGYGWNANPWVWCLTFKRVEDGNHA